MTRLRLPTRASHVHLDRERPVAVFWLSKFCGPGSQFLSCGDSGRLIDRMGLFTFSLLTVRSSANATGSASSLGGRSTVAHCRRTFRSPLFPMSLAVLACDNAADVEHVHHGHEISQHLRSVLFSFKSVEAISQLQALGKFVILDPTQPLICWKDRLIEPGFEPVHESGKNQAEAINEVVGLANESGPWSTPSSSNC